MNKTYLIHHGVKGQRWGIRRFQNEDGSLKNKAKNRFKTGEPKKKKDLTPEEKKARKSKGLKITGGILAGIGVMVAADFAMAKTKGDMSLFDAGQMAVKTLTWKV